MIIKYYAGQHSELIQKSSMDHPPINNLKIPKIIDCDIKRALASTVSSPYKAIEMFPVVDYLKQILFFYEILLIAD